MLVGGVVRGRSREVHLNAIHRSAIPSIVGGGLQPGPSHVRSDESAGDAGSRRRAVELRQQFAHLWVLMATLGWYGQLDVEVALDALHPQVGAWGRLFFRLRLSLDSPSIVYYLDRRDLPAPLLTLVVTHFNFPDDDVSLLLVVVPPLDYLMVCLACRTHVFPCRRRSQDFHRSCESFLWRPQSDARFKSG